jgi:hypothetical protein
VDALVANTPEKTREIVLVFERPLEQPQQQQEEEAARRGEAEAAAAAQRAAAAEARRSILPRLQKEAAEAEAAEAAAAAAAVAEAVAAGEDAEAVAEAEAAAAEAAAAAAGPAVQGSGSATGGADYVLRNPPRAPRDITDRVRREVSRFVYLPGLRQVRCRLLSQCLVSSRARASFHDPLLPPAPPSPPEIAWRSSGEITRDRPELTRRSPGDCLEIAWRWLRPSVPGGDQVCIYICQVATRLNQTEGGARIGAWPDPALGRARARLLRLPRAPLAALGGSILSPAGGAGPLGHWAIGPLGHWGPPRRCLGCLS